MSATQGLASDPPPRAAGGLRFRSLASGSSANATLVAGRGATDQSPFHVLVDCGLNQRQLRARLQRAGLQPADLHAVFVTHEHSDHVGASFELALALDIPIWASYGTWLGAGQPDCRGLLRIARDGLPVQWGAMQATPFTVPHDAREPLQLRIAQDGDSIALLTDLGHVTPHVLAHAAQCDALLLEFNHEPELLSQSRYPPFLKRRIAGRQGHLSNQAAAELLAQVLHPRLKQVVAGHLSRQNNTPELAMQWMRRAIGSEGVALSIADQEQGCGWIDASGALPERDAGAPDWAATACLQVSA